MNQDYIMQIDRLVKVRTTILMERFKETVRLDLDVIYIFWQNRGRKDAESFGRK